MDVLENILELDTVYFAGLVATIHRALGSSFRDCTLLFGQSHLLFRQTFDHRILFGDNKLICLDGIPLRKVHDFSFQTVDCESLGRGDLQNSFNVDNDFVEIGVFLFKLLESLLLINLKHLLFDSHATSFIFLVLVIKVYVKHVLQ